MTVSKTTHPCSRIRLLLRRNQAGRLCPLIVVKAAGRAGEQRRRMTRWRFAGPWPSFTRTSFRCLFFGLARGTSALAVATACLTVGAAGGGGEAIGEPTKVLFGFESKLDASVLQPVDATAVVRPGATGGVLQVQTGHRQTWPGVGLKGPASGWDLSKFAQVRLVVRNVGTNAVTVYARVDNAGADGRNHCVTASVKVPIGATQTLRVALNRYGPGKLGGKLFGLRGYPAEIGGEGTVDPARISQVLIFVSQPKEEHRFEVDDIVAGGTVAAPTAMVTDADPYFPLIDTFGQYRHRDWPGKVHSLADLRQRRQDEERELVGEASPEGWDRYGGWAAGPQLNATGYFRTEKHGGNWWLVDPDGRLFFSHGIDCVVTDDVTPVEERASWFEQFPGDDPELAEFLVARAYALKGHYAGRSPKCFSFARANLKRKYGADWRQEYPQVVQRRLRSWGLNTIGNWSDEGTRRLRRTPYTDSLSSHGARNIEGSDGYWGKFPDPFDPGFRASLRRGMAGRKGRSAGDPWCLGYFSDNEMSWGDELSLALAALKSPADQPAKQAFVADLRERHGEIGTLNRAWGTLHESWDALLASRVEPEIKRARPDLERFASRLADEYFRTVRDVIREVAPHQMYLGCRFAWVNPRAVASASRYCDVVSYNLYQRDISDFVVPGKADVPILIGEFHFGALDRGMFHTGLVPVASQAERAAAYENYLRGALRHPQVVGTHWFQYQDEPTTGRVYDEENYQIGFVDIADTPYAETVAAARRVGKEMYRLRLAADSAGAIRP